MKSHKVTVCAFEDHAGQYFENGKVYYPAQLQLKMSHNQALEMIEYISRQMQRSDFEQTDITLVGAVEITETYIQ